MNDLDQIKADIVATKAKLTEAERIGDVARRDRLEVLLTEQQKKENILLAGAGDCHFNCVNFMMLLINLFVLLVKFCCECHLMIILFYFMSLDFVRNVYGISQIMIILQKVSLFCFISCC